MTLIDQLQKAMQMALKSSENDRVRTLRTLIAKLKDKSIEKGDELSDEEEIKILQTASKQRKEAAEMFTKGNRTELAESELNELSIIKEYLTEELSEANLIEIIDKIIKIFGKKRIVFSDQPPPQFPKNPPKKSVMHTLDRPGRG